MTIILFLLLLSIIIVIHEFGHLIAAKIFGVYCQEFSFGMGPALISKQFGETKYSIRAFPIGGYVAMAGDNDNPIEPEVAKDIPFERTLKGISPIKRIIVMLAGIFMNFVLAFVILAIVLLNNGSYAVSPDNTIFSVEENYPAYNAGIKAGDKIVKVYLADGSIYDTDSFEEISMYLSAYEGQGTISLDIEREGRIINYNLTPILESSDDGDRYVIGITSPGYTFVDINLGNFVKYTFEYMFTLTKSIYSSLLNLLRGAGLSNLSGPVGIYSITSEAVSMGAGVYFSLMAMLSLNVGIFNALPLPIMDGGRVLITIIEMIIGKEISKKVENMIMSLSMLLLLMLLVFTTFNDISKFFF